MASCITSSRSVSHRNWPERKQWRTNPLLPMNCTWLEFRVFYPLTWFVSWSLEVNASLLWVTKTHSRPVCEVAPPSTFTLWLLKAASCIWKFWLVGCEMSIKSVSSVCMTTTGRPAAKFRQVSTTVGSLWCRLLYIVLWLGLLLHVCLWGGSATQVSFYRRATKLPILSHPNPRSILICVSEFRSRMLL